MSIEVQHDPESRAFTATLDGAPAGQLYYRPVGDDRWDMYLTKVRPEFEGHGVGSALCRVAVAAARAQGVAIDPSCWFVAGWLDRHPEAAA